MERAVALLLDLAVAVPLARNEFSSNCSAGRVQTCCVVATLALVLYEYIITLGSEVEYIHKAERSLPKCAFLVNRYFVLLLSIFQTMRASQQLHFRNPHPHPECRTVMAADCATRCTVLASCIVQFILLLRLYAFWNRSRRVLVSVVATYVACATASFVGIALDTARIRVPRHLPDACVAPPSPRLWLVILPAVFFDTVIVALTVVRARQLRDREHTPLITHLYRTGVGYYLVTLACNAFLAAIFCVSGSTTINSALLAPPTTLPSAVSSIVCTRMLLSLRATVRRRSASPEIPESELRRASASAATSVTAV
ncbi:hypothetical protein AURDEDRAFT_121529 [Auricularia subglabra TFB-10046 SS5]|nr:hypothetical protein AURDEDRAFT_121529 [Auricularia subglabra TFB-10046 SS5]